MRVFRVQSMDVGNDVHPSDHRIRRYLREYGQFVDHNRRWLHLRWNLRCDIQGDEPSDSSRKNEKIVGRYIQVWRRSLRIFR